MDRSPSAKRSQAPTFDNLRRAGPFDAIGVGIGLFNLSLAALLAPTSFHARFFERNADFQWHPGLLFPEATIQVSYPSTGISR
jgi:lysine/ornithine N-monooxygenase